MTMRPAHRRSFLLGGAAAMATGGCEIGFPPRATADDVMTFDRETGSPETRPRARQTLARRSIWPGHRA